MARFSPDSLPIVGEFCNARQIDVEILVKTGIVSIAERVRLGVFDHIVDRVVPRVDVFV